MRSKSYLRLCNKAEMLNKYTLLFQRADHAGFHRDYFSINYFEYVGMLCFLVSVIIPAYFVYTLPNRSLKGAKLTLV